MEKEKVKDYIQWDVRTWSESIKYFNSFIKNDTHATALTLGDRDGGLSLWLGLKGIDVFYSDLKEITIKGKEIHNKYGISSKVKYTKIDIRKIDFDSCYFDIVAFKSVLGALPDTDSKQKALDEIYRVLKPGGILLFSENMEGLKVYKYLRKYFTTWGKRWNYFNVHNDISLFKNFKSLHYQTNGIIALLGRNEKQRYYLSFIDDLLSKFTPSSFRYMIYGAATK